MAKRSTFRHSVSKKAGVSRRRLRRAFLKLVAARICQALEAARGDDLALYQYLYTAGEWWVQAKEELAHFRINIDGWAKDNLPISRQWMDKHEELYKRWDEFVLALAWSDQLPWEKDRRPSLHKALDMMDGKKRYDNFTTATTRAFSPPPQPAGKEGKLDISLVDFLLGDALEVLRSLPSGSVNTCVTSPPYWGSLRDYGDHEQLGWEPDPNIYVAKLVAIFTEMLRVLAPDGTLWLVMGDAYASPGVTWTAQTHKLIRSALRGTEQKGSVPAGKARPKTAGIELKNLLLMAARVALALQDAGWVLRAEIIWEKVAVHPESVKDRPTRSHEMIYLFAKQSDYFYDADAIRVPLAEPLSFRSPPRKDGVVRKEQLPAYFRRWGNPLGRNARTVWRIRPKPYHGNHPAPFPVELAERCLKATLPPGGIVIDPFAGAGTTAIAALRLGASKAILIDLNQGYLDEARDRIAATQAPSHAAPSQAIPLSEQVTLYTGDCRFVLARLPETSIDVITVDPPYWLRVPPKKTLIDFHRENNERKPRIREAWDEFHSVDDYLEFTDEWLTNGLRLLNSKGSMFIFANQHNLGLINYSLQRLNIQFMNHIVWHKPNSEPNLSGRRLQNRHEAIIWAIKAPGYRFNYQALKAKGYPDKQADVQMSDVWKIGPVGRKEAIGHPAQKPVALYERLLDMCGVVGGTLLDPMAGSGTAAIAAAQWGMRAILIEREVSYVEMIQQRWADFVARQQSPANDNEPEDEAEDPVGSK